MGRPAKQFKPEIVELLGKVPDAQIARMARCSITAVVNRRHKLSIAPYRVNTAVAPAAPTITPSTPALTVVSAAAVTTVPAVGIPAVAPVENKLHATVREAVTAAKAGPSGMTIPYELFARLAQEVLA
jgi:hypothetical protein